MKQKYIISLLWSITILFAFFLGYVFSLKEHELEIQKIRETPVYIDVTTSKKNISIKEIPEHIFLRVNGELIQSGSINLKE